MGMSTLLKITEGVVTDPRTNTDKFYRVYALESEWTTHYGRNGELGTIGKIVDAGDREAARAAAAKKYQSKVRSSGYRTTFDGELQVSDILDLSNPSQVAAVVDQFLDEHRDPDQNWDGSATFGEIAPAPIAQKLRDRTDQVAAALRDGYWGGARTVPADIEPVDAILPMLASTVSAHQLAELMDSRRWVAQRKYDGDRVMVRVADGEVSLLNRRGQTKTRNVSIHHTTPFTALHTGHWLFDGEVVGSTLVLFDLLYATNGTTTWVHNDISFTDRHRALSIIVSTLNLDSEHITLAPVHQDKHTLLTEAVENGHEGIILREADAPYQQGLRSASLVKHKLIKDADVVVTALHATKDSATLSVYEADGTMREVGAASTIGKGEVKVGDVWVVTYLYVTDPAHPRMFQPRLVRRREDKTAQQCLIDQFAHAGTNKEL